MPELLGDMVAALLALPPSAIYGVIAVLAAVENVFPPVPADTAVAVGAFLSVGGTVSVWTVLLVTWTSNTVTAVGVYLVGRTWGRRFFRGRIGRRLLHPRSLQRLETLYERYGTWGIFLSRFVPVLRAVVPPFAGLAGLGAARAVLPMAAASMIWYGTIAVLAKTAVRGIPQLVRLVRGINQTALIFGAVVAVAAVLIWWRRHRAKVGNVQESQR